MRGIALMQCMAPDIALIALIVRALGAHMGAFRKHNSTLEAEIAGWARSAGRWVGLGKQRCRQPADPQTKTWEQRIGI